MNKNSIQSQGGNARAKALTKEQRITIAKRAANARWANRPTPLIPKTIVKPITAIAWCGLYNDKTLGWLMPKFIDQGRPTSLDPEQIKALKEKGRYQYAISDMYRVKITVRPIKNKHGKYIMKKALR